jgi:hypothetical protein
MGLCEGIPALSSVANPDEYEGHTEVDERLLRLDGVL